MASSISMTAPDGSHRGHSIANEKNVPLYVEVLRESGYKNIVVRGGGNGGHHNPGSSPNGGGGEMG